MPRFSSPRRFVPSFHGILKLRSSRNYKRLADKPMNGRYCRYKSMC